MDIAVKQRLIGAFVLAALAMIFLPMILPGSDVEDSDASEVPLTLPAAPNQKFETRELPLPAPAAPADPSSPAEADPNAVVTVDAAAAAPRQTAESAATEVAVDAATGEPLPAPTTPTSTTPTSTAPPTAAAAPAPAPVSAVPATPAVSPTAPAAAAPLNAASGGYAVNVGSFSNLANARALEARLHAAGMPVHADNLDLAGKPALRLRVGPYAERAAAEAARLRVQGVAGAAGQVIALDGGTGATATTAPAVASKALATASVGFAVQLGALRVEADAVALRDRARAAGFVAFHQRMDGESGVLFRVRVGPEADRGAAEKLRDAVATKLGVAGLVVSHP